jgi:hypothetical protein
MGIMAALTTSNSASTSRYNNTPFVSRKVNYLDYWKYTSIQLSANDSQYQLDGKYNLRPDLLSYDLYGTIDLWWVFMVANPDVIKDPIYDFVTGTIIYIPNSQTVGAYL